MRHAVPCGLILSARVPDPVDVDLLWLESEVCVFSRIVVEADYPLLVHHPLPSRSPVDSCSSRLGLDELSLDAFLGLFEELNVLEQLLLKPWLSILVYPLCSDELVIAVKVVAHLKVQVLDYVALVVEGVADNLSIRLVHSPAAL